MRVQFWNNIGNVYWLRLFVCVLAAGGAWGALAAVVPTKLHVLVTSILGGATAGIGILIRGTKYIKDRNEAPRSGDV